ncbi:MAG: hypothetical protein BWY09_02235 [Candidatus Hydrogenedentes bacterium ADurb.Bin179]|nr:MAG: hypothetical protein BWY09_02235 [Candidatus Hydrogenedentes bacterium ADurb.Bin179]
MGYETENSIPPILGTTIAQTSQSDLQSLIPQEDLSFPPVHFREPCLSVHTGDTGVSIRKRHLTVNTIANGFLGQASRNAFGQSHKIVFVFFYRFVRGIAEDNGYRLFRKLT